MLKIKSLSKIYSYENKKVEALRGVSLEIKKGEFVAVVGPSGCGKTTLLKCVAGLLDYTKGDIKFENDVKKDMSMVFQNFSSFPWLTVRENIEFGLNIKKIDIKKRNTIANNYLSTTGLKDYADFYPKNLSGGMKQRIALAMSLAGDPRLTLMDEPFGALDTQTRSLMQ